MLQLQEKKTNKFEIETLSTFIKYTKKTSIMLIEGWSAVH